MWEHKQDESASARTTGHDLKHGDLVFWNLAEGEQPEGLGQLYKADECLWSSLEGMGRSRWWLKTHNIPEKPKRGDAMLFQFGRDGSKYWTVRDVDVLTLTKAMPGEVAALQERWRVAAAAAHPAEEHAEKHAANPTRGGKRRKRQDLAARAERRSRRRDKFATNQ